MCGIAGIISADRANVTGQQLKKMTDAIAHRGPEGEHFWINPSGTAGLGHRRLSIIDPSPAAAQPMHYLQRYSIVFNGSIFNYPELREELSKKGYPFYTHSDTEVILAAYACWKKHCLQHLDGMFAFAIWDEEAQELFVARDRFGEKPFFYFSGGNTLWFASEMKSLYAAGIPRHANDSLLLLFLTNGIADAPAASHETFDRAIQQLPPACCMVYQCRNGRPSTRIEQYWDINKERETEYADEMKPAREFYRLLAASVEKRFRSDVPVGTSLSGGLDSAALAAIGSGIAAGSNSYKCFSAVFPGFVKDESRYSQMVARQLKLSQFVTAPTAEDLAADLQRFFYHHDEPVGSASVYAQYKVYQLAKQQGVTVLLDGQGADELLAGYAKYLHWYLQELIRRQPGSLKEALRALRHNRVRFAWGWKNYAAAWLPGMASAQLEKKVLKNIAKNTDINPAFRNEFTNSELVQKPVVTKLNDILYFNARRSGLQELLRYADRNSMAHACEVRLPYLSQELADFCFALPAVFKIRHGYSKWVLRKSMERQLPKEVVWRTDKVGFEPPQKSWMENTRVQELIRSAKENLVKRGVLLPAALNKKIQPHDAHAADNTDWWYLAAGLPA